MFEDKTLVCKECGEEFILLPENRNFMRRKALLMSHNVANPVVMQEKQHRELTERCSQLFVHLAVLKQKFLSNLVKTDLYIAVNVLRSRKRKKRLNCLE